MCVLDVLHLLISEEQDKSVPRTLHLASCSTQEKVVFCETVRRHPASNVADNTFKQNMRHNEASQPACSYCALVCTANSPSLKIHP